MSVLKRIYEGVIQSMNGDKKLFVLLEMVFIIFVVHIDNIWLFP